MFKCSLVPFFHIRVRAYIIYIGGFYIPMVQLIQAISISTMTKGYLRIFSTMESNQYLLGLWRHFTMVSVLLAGTPVQVAPEISLPRCLVVVVKGEERGM